MTDTIFDIGHRRP